MPAAKTKSKPLGYKMRREELLRILPTNGFNIADAARQVGYSKSYAETKLACLLRDDVDFNRRLERLQAINVATAEDKVAALDLLVDTMIDDPETSRVLRVKLIEMRYRRFGALADKTITEDGARAAELTESQVREARAYTQWRLTQGRDAG